MHIWTLGVPKKGPKRVPKPSNKAPRVALATREALFDAVVDIVGQFGPSFELANFGQFGANGVQPRSKSASRVAGAARGYLVDGFGLFVGPFFGTFFRGSELQGKTPPRYLSIMFQSRTPPPDTAAGAGWGGWGAARGVATSGAGGALRAHAYATSGGGNGGGGANNRHLRRRLRHNRWRSAAAWRSPRLGPGAAAHLRAIGRHASAALRADRRWVRSWGRRPVPAQHRGHPQSFRMGARQRRGRHRPQTARRNEPAVPTPHVLRFGLLG